MWDGTFGQNNTEKSDDPTKIKFEKLECRRVEGKAYVIKN